MSQLMPLFAQKNKAPWWMVGQRAFGITVLLWFLAGPGAQAQTPDFTPQKRSLAIPIAVKPPRSVQCVVPFGPAVSVSAVAFSPDGKKLAAAGYQEVVVWDLENAKLSRRIGTGKLGTSIGALTFLKDARLLAVGEGTPQSSGSVRIFDVETGNEIQAFKEPREVVYSLALSPDGKLLAAGGAEPVARVWSVNEKKLVATIEGHRGWVLGVAFSRDGKLLATASADSSAGIWDVATWKSVIRLPEVETVRGVAFGADGISLVLAVGGPSQWSLRMRRRDNIRYARAFSTEAGMPLRVVWTPKRNWIYVPSSDGIVRRFDGNGRLLARLAGHEDWVYGVAVNVQETTVASGSADGTVKLWSTQDNRLLATLIQLSPSGDEWMITTPPGYLAASSAETLEWKTANVKTPSDKLASVFQKPESVRQAIAGEKVAPPVLK